MRYISRTVDVPAAGTRVQVSNTRDRVLWIRFTARQGNVGGVYVGDSTVSATNGRELRPPETTTGYDQMTQTEYDFGRYPGPAGQPGSVLLNVFYVDTDTGGNDVDWEALLF